MKFPYVRAPINPCDIAYSFNEYVSSQNLGIRQNLESVLGRNPLLWCCPTVPPGSGLKYKLAEGDGKWIELRRGQHESEGYYEENVDHQA